MSGESPVAGSRVAYLGKLEGEVTVIGGMVLKVLKSDCHVAVPPAVNPAAVDEILRSEKGVEFIVVRVGRAQLAEDSEAGRAVLTKGETRPSVSLALAPAVGLVRVYEEALDRDYSAESGDANPQLIALTEAGRLSPSLGSYAMVSCSGGPDGENPLASNGQLETMMTMMTQMLEQQQLLSARVQSIEKKGSGASSSKDRGPAAPSASAVASQQQPVDNAAAQAARLLASSGLWGDTVPPPHPALRTSGVQGEAAAAPLVRTVEPRTGAQPGEHQAIGSDDESVSDDESSPEQNAPPLILSYRRRKAGQRRGGSPKIKASDLEELDANTRIQYEVLKMMQTMNKRGRQCEESGDSSGSETGYVRRHQSGGIAGLHRQRRKFKRNPLRAVVRFRKKVMRKLGVQVTEGGVLMTPWAYTDYAHRVKSQFGRMVGLWKVFFALCKVLNLCENQEHELVAGTIAQLLKCLHQTALDGGHWGNASLLLPWSDPLEREQWAGEEDELEVNVKYQRSVRDLGLGLSKNANWASNGVQEDGQHGPDDDHAALAKGEGKGKRSARRAAAAEAKRLATGQPEKI